MRKKLLILALSLSLLAVSAQAGPFSLYLGLQGGVSTQKPSVNSISFEPDSSILYGVKAGFKLFMFCLEASFFESAHNLRVSDPSVSAWNGRAVEYNYAGVNLRWNFPFILITPYLTGGYGYYGENIKDLPKKSNAGYNLGAGAEFKLGKISLLAEGRYHRVKMNIEGTDFSFKNFTWIGGLNFYF
jgi:opacity protein-like surface antigen